jgi:hypothetical protein
MSRIQRAWFIRTADESGGGGGEPPSGAIGVQFNPSSLQYGVQINNQQQGATPQATQHVAQAEATLEMELLFDTTDSGKDVRSKSLPIRMLASAGDPHEQASTESAANRAPPRVAFVWGTFRFVGVLTGFRETLDFFSADGVPVRSNVRVSMKSTETSEVYAGPQADAAAKGLGSSLGFGSGNAAGAPGAGGGGGGGFGIGVSVGISAGGGSVSGSARLMPGFATAAAGRAAAAALGSESPRLPQPGGALQPVSASARLATPSPRTTAGVSFGAAADFGVGGQVSGGSGAGVRSSLSGSLRFTSSGAS